MPRGVRRGHNLTAFRGGSRLRGVDDVPALSPDDDHPGAAPPPPSPADWRMI